MEGRASHGTPFAFLAGNRPVPLRGVSRLSLTILIGYDVVQHRTVGGESSTVRVTDYSYQVIRGDGRELLAYQWHPIGQSWMTEPHLHLGGMLSGFDMSKAHLPTAQVSLQSFLRFLILDLEVEPLRPDWRLVLGVPSDVPTP
jgi:hypothetical protein